jgi:trigger factor
MQEVEVNLNYDEITAEIDEAYKEERKNLEIDGFRKGKAPIAMLKKLYGEAIEFKASEKIATEKFWAVVDKENLKPISTPQLVDIDFERGIKLFFKIQFEIKPKLELKNYTNLKIEKLIFKVSEEDIEKEFEYLLKPHVKYEPAEIVNGKYNRITVNLQKLDESGVAVIGQRSENMVIDLSDEKVNPKILVTATGLKVNEKFLFNFVDEHYHGEELHIEEFRYEAEITKIEKIVLPELTEDIMMKISGNKAATSEEFKEQLRKNFNEYYIKQSEEIFTNSLLNEIVKNNDFTPPAGFVKTIHNRFVELEKEKAKRYKMPSVDENAIAEHYKPRAEWNAKWQIILENIAEKENIKVEDTDLEALANQEAEKTGISAQKLFKYYKDSDRGNILLEDKVIDFLKKNTIVKEVDAEEKQKKNKGK